jgi:hypothetical protein
MTYTDAREAAWTDFEADDKSTTRDMQVGLHHSYTALTAIQVTDRDDIPYDIWEKIIDLALSHPLQWAPTLAALRQVCTGFNAICVRWLLSSRNSDKLQSLPSVVRGRYAFDYAIRRGHVECAMKIWRSQINCFFSEEKEHRLHQIFDILTPKAAFTAYHLHRLSRQSISPIDGISRILDWKARAVYARLLSHNQKSCFVDVINSADGVSAEDIHAFIISSDVCGLVDRYKLAVERCMHPNVYTTLITFIPRCYFNPARLNGVENPIRLISLIRVIRNHLPDGVRFDTPMLLSRIMALNYLPEIEYVLLQSRYTTDEACFLAFLYSVFSTLTTRPNLSADNFLRMLEIHVKEGFSIMQDFVYGVDPTPEYHYTFALHADCKRLLADGGIGRYISPREFAFSHSICDECKHIRYCFIRHDPDCNSDSWF